MKAIIKKMLKENTGKHFLDSGSAYGRNWERNQETNFDKEPRVSYEIYGNEISVTVSIYHYLSEILSNDETSKKINSMIARQRNKANKINDNDIYPHWIQECCDLIEDKEHVLGELSFPQDAVNTYNYDSNISQVLLFQVFKVYDEPYVMLQIHGGCDIRGGYTDARCFKLNGYLTGNVDVYGTINGIEVSNTYDGFNIRNDETDEKIEINEDQVNDIDFDFYVIEDTYMY